MPKVFVNFNKPDQKALDKITVKDAREYYDKGEFGAGSMGPKVMACVKYVENGGKQALITEASQMEFEGLRN